jgi:predicted transcriptional regulator
MDHMAKDKTTDWKTTRRKLAWELCQAGRTHKDIAEALGVPKGAVSQWIKRAKKGDEAALQAQPRFGSGFRQGCR